MVEQMFRAYSSEKYQKWLEGLKEESLCTLQIFKPKDTGLMGNSVEHWRYYSGVFWGGSVYCTDRHERIHPLNKKGECCYLNSEDAWGECFPARIVPNGSWTPVLSSLRSYDAPVYELKWVGHRNLFISRKGGSYYDVSDKAHLFLHHGQEQFPFYYYKVRDGEIFVVFGERKSVKTLLKDTKLNFIFYFLCSYKTINKAKNSRNRIRKSAE